MRTISVLAFAVLALCGCDDGVPDEDAGPEVELTCESYCGRVQAGCTGDEAQYGDRESCLSTCATMPAGSLSDTSGNTLGCRQYHVGEVEELGAEHCHHAGPAGGHDEGCGTNCESFCSIVQGACTGANEQFADVAACMTACEGITDDEEFTANVTSGNSLACRLYHATVASLGGANATTHCPHVAVVSSTCM
jgi:hypothetical protein